MMSEETYGPDEGYRHIPEANLWLDEPLGWRDIPAAEWSLAARVIEDLMPLADHTTEGLTSAMGDALERAREEVRRASEREATPESERNRFGLTPGEDGRLRTLMRRSDALNQAVTTVLDNPSPSIRVHEEALAELRILSEEADEEVKHYKRELGMPERGRPE